MANALAYLAVLKETATIKIKPLPADRRRRRFQQSVEHRRGVERGVVDPRKVRGRQNCRLG
jgi:hypothetical protein